MTHYYQLVAEILYTRSTETVGYTTEQLFDAEGGINACCSSNEIIAYTDADVASFEEYGEYMVQRVYEKRTGLLTAIRALKHIADTDLPSLSTAELRKKLQDTPIDQSILIDYLHCLAYETDHSDHVESSYRYMAIGILLGIPTDIWYRYDLPF